MTEDHDYQNNPLHGVSLKQLVTEIAQHYGFKILFAYLNINCFANNPSVESAVKFLKKTDWAREKVEAFYLYQFKSLPRASAEQFELPPRHQWDGVAQCYVVHAWRQCAALQSALGRADAAATWEREAAALAARFRETYWRGDHFAEYVHPERGVVDAHGLSDVNWAAIAYDVATPAQVDAVWPRLMAEPAFWRADMPTQTVTRPFAYEPWEFVIAHEDVGFEIPVAQTYDVAAMGRVWFLEWQACRRRGEVARLRKSVELVCRRGLADGGFWHERYHPLPDGSIDHTGPRGYGEYPAILVRAVLGNPALFADAWP